MIDHWPFWISAAALAGVALVHWFALHRLMAVSGRFTAFVDRAPAAEAPMSEEDLIAAMRAATEEEFGTGKLLDSSSAPAMSSSPDAASVATLPRESMTAHAMFLGGLLLGGLVSAVLAGAFEITSGLRSIGFTDVFGSSGVAQSMVLVVGGVLVGFGTRMASGCTSGHGLCGVSRAQVGSLAATMAFFGTGIVVSFLLGALR